MVRQARVVIPWEFYHLTQRGNYQQTIFEDDRDRNVYLKLINDNCRKWGVDIYAYCLMTNHVHFVVRPHDTDSLARAFSVSHMCYSQYFNRKSDVKGHLWQGRFYTCQLKEGHLREAIRYVECNPVRAGLVSKPWDYKWSSVHVHLGGKSSIVQLSDIGDVLEIGSWKEYLLERQQADSLENIRIATFKGVPALLGGTD